MIVSTFDIEATSLNADWGIPLGFVFKTFILEERPKGNARPRFLGQHEVFDITMSPTWPTRNTDDRWLLKQFTKCWDAADMVVSYNGIRFDEPFILSRLLHNGMKPLVPKFHLDLYRQVTKWKLATSRRSLERVSTFLNTHARKYHCDSTVWIKAAGGDKESIESIVHKHCVMDVDTLEEIYYKLLPFINMLRRR